MGRSRWMLLVLAVAVLVGSSGCSVLQSLGFKSAGMRAYEQAQRENEELATQLVASRSEQDRLKEELTAAQEARRRAEEAAKAVTAGRPGDKNLNDLATRLGALGIPTTSGKAGKGVRLTGDILFRAGKVGIRSEAKPLLAKVAGIVSKAEEDVVIYVDGHTDADPLVVTKHLYKDNYGLAAARANSVARELMTLGVPKAKLVTRSFGPDYPVADNKSVAGKAQNRRVEISLAYAPASGVAAPLVSSGK